LYILAQGSLPFLNYTATLAEAHNAVGPTTITSTIYKYHLIFHAHNMLILRIMAISEFDIDMISFNNLIALMSMQWNSLIAEGSACPGCPSPYPPSQSSMSITPAPATQMQPCLPVLTNKEKDHLSKAGGCC
jgi:hypothetical protein